MEKRFRALRIVATFIKVLAWIALVGGILGAVLIVIVSIVGGNSDAVGSMLNGVPYTSGLAGLASGLLAGVAVLIVSLIYFVVLYASAESIHLGLAIEQNTRETAYYLRGENQMQAPPPPQY